VRGIQTCRQERCQRGFPAARRADDHDSAAQSFSECVRSHSHHR
jgi:hypothetical protein